MVQLMYPNNFGTMTHPNLKNNNKAPILEKDTIEFALLTWLKSPNEWKWSQCWFAESANENYVHPYIETYKDKQNMA